jgi:hypothetical protein
MATEVNKFCPGKGSGSGKISVILASYEII